MLDRMRSQHSLRALLSGMVTALFVLVLASLGGLLYWQIGRHLWRVGEHRLRDAAVTALEHTYGSDDLPDGWEGRAETLSRDTGAGPLLARVLRPDGTLLAASGGPLRSPPVDPGALSHLRDDVQDGRATLYLAHTGHQHWQTLLVPLRRQGRLVGVLEVAVDWGPSADVLSALLGYLLAGGVVAIVLTLLAARRISRTLAAPLERLAAATRRIAGGDLGARTGIPSGVNEVDAVAADFDAMAERLEETFEAQRRFVADASHELRTPITTLGGMADLLNLDMDGGDPTKRRRAIQAITEEAGRMSRLVNDLLDLSRLDGDAPLPADSIPLADLLEEVRAHAAQQGREVSVASTVGGARLTGSREQLGRALRNLVENAFKYGGAVRLTADQDGDRVHLSVHDDGPGIAAADLPHVFDRFYRADTSRTRSTGGSGLGLSIVKAIATRHGGDVAAESVEGCGTTVRITLPLAPTPLA